MPAFPIIEQFIRRFSPVLRFVFDILYHQAAPFYDLVAWAVSGGQWHLWGQQAHRLIYGNRILEIGFGTGHLLEYLVRSPNLIIGLDESYQMCRIAKSRLSRSIIRYSAPLLVRGAAQKLPFDSDAFDSIICNFPADFIYETDTLKEIYRVLTPGGRMIFLAGAWSGKNTLVKWFASTLWYIIGLPPPEKFNLTPHLSALNQSGFASDTHWISINRGLVLYIVAEKSR